MAPILLGIVLVTIVSTIVWIWFLMNEPLKPITKQLPKPEIKLESYRNSDPEPEVENDVTGIEMIRKPETAATLSNTLSSKDKDSTGCGHHSPANLKINEDYIQKLEKDHLFYQHQIGQFQKQFQDLNAIIKGFEEMGEENRRLKEKVNSLQRIVSEYRMMDVKKDADQTHLLIDQLKVESYDLKKKYQQTCLENDELKLKLVAARDSTLKELILNRDLQSNLAQLKEKLSSCEFAVDEIKNEQSVLREKASMWQSNESQHLQELKATIQTQNEMLSSKMSELDLAKEENNLLMSDLNSLKYEIAEKLIEMNELSSKLSEQENQTLISEFNNDDLKKKIKDSHKIIQNLQTVNQELRDDREAAILSARLSAQNAEKLPDDQVDALSKTVSALQEAVNHVIYAATSENTTEDLQKTGPKVEQAAPASKATGIERWLIKHRLKTHKTQQESELIKLRESKGEVMIETSKKLKEQAKYLKEKGKALKKEAKKLPRQ